MMQKMRGQVGKILGVLFALAFVGWMVFELGMDVSGRGQNARAGEMGRVNGEPVLYQAYQAAYQELYQQVQQQSGGQVSAEQQRALEEEAWNRVVNDMLLRQAMRDLGVRATDAEIRQAALWNPHPALMQNELFQTNGQFDLRKYQEFLSGPNANEETLLQLEQYYRQAVPQSKLLRQLTAGVYVSDAELWRAFQDRSETATVEYVALDAARLAPGEAQVSDREIRAYYDSHQDEFKRPATARLTLAFLPKAQTAADTVATLQRAQQLRAEIQGGADFAEVAQRESQDPGSKANGGDLGFFGRGQMVSAFDEAAFSTPVGQISEPVLTPFGYHIIRVEEKRDDQVRARHILLPIEKSEEELARLDAKADSLESLARRQGIERAARVTGATVRSGVTVSEASPFVPGVGSALEAVDWAKDATEEEQKVSELMETEQALFVARLESYTPKGMVPLKEATPQIRRQLAAQKKLEQARVAGQKLVEQARAGKTLQQVAAANGLQVQQAGPFTRVEPNPVFGQANAAIGAAFGVPVGKVSDVVKTSGGLFIIRPVARTEADRKAWEAQKEQQRAMAMAQLQQEAFVRWMQSRRKSAEIEDNRDRFFQRST
jgi:peptidyl-prolyl cis-trans isomerase D